MSLLSAGSVLRTPGRATEGPSLRGRVLSSVLCGFQSCEETAKDVAAHILNFVISRPEGHSDKHAREEVTPE